MGASTAQRPTAYAERITPADLQVGTEGIAADLRRCRQRETVLVAAVDRLEAQQREGLIAVILP